MKDKITDLNQVDITLPEGRLLMAAIAKISTESQSDKTPNKIIRQLNKLKRAMFKLPEN